MASTSMNQPKQQQEAELQRKVEFYHSKFPHVPSVSSSHLLDILQQQRKDDNNIKENPHHQDPLETANLDHVDPERVMIVDVRTKPERETSMIAKAISLQELKHRLTTKDPSAVALTAADQQSQQQHPNNDVNDNHPNFAIVCYCTVGFRSGLEASRLMQQYPEYANHIYNLDGILAYTHAVQNRQEQQQKEQDDHGNVGLVDPKTGTATRKVHVFGPSWNLVDSSVYESIHFGRLELQARLAQVSALVSVRTAQGAMHKYTNCCR